MTRATWTRRLPWSIVGIAALLVLAGWLGIARYEELTDGGGRFLRRQIVWSILAALVLVAATRPNYRILRDWSPIVFLLSLALLVVVFFFDPINGARRWIRLGPIGFQPSEFAKVAFVLLLARYLMVGENLRRTSGLIVPVVLTLIPVFLILVEPDLGTSLVFLPVTFTMLLAAGARRRDLGVLVLVALATAPLLWTQMSPEQRSRVTGLFEQVGPGEVASGDAYHLRQAKQVMALGGVWGSWVGGEPVDDPVAYHLPEAHSDFIFCLLRERFGLPGAAAVLVLFGLLAWRGLAVAMATREPFGRLMAVGLVALISVQVLINTGMTVGLLPITGLSLPLVSYGGSGLVAQGLVLGLLLNVGLRPGYDVTKEPFRYVKT